MTDQGLAQFGLALGQLKYLKELKLYFYQYFPYDVAQVFRANRFTPAGLAYFARMAGGDQVRRIRDFEMYVNKKGYYRLSDIIPEMKGRPGTTK